MVESLQVFSEKKIKTIGIEINKKAKFRSWKTLKDCGKGPGKSWNFKILKRVQTPAGNLCTVKPLLVDTSLIRTPLYYGQFPTSHQNSHILS